MVAAVQLRSDVQAMGSRSTARFYSPELDVLRFFAFLAVFIFHAASPMQASGILKAITGAGHFGVDLFFILSAYLITQLLLREREMRGSLDIRSFYVRRMLRIWPLYFFFIALSVWMGYVQRRPLGVNYICSFVLLSGNWMCALKGLPAFSVIFPLWSISVEEQFYLLWPLAARRVSKHVMVWIAAALLLVGTAARLLLAVRPAIFSDIEYVSFVRVDGIAWGILLAVFLPPHKMQLARVWRVLLFAVGTSSWIITNSIVDARSLTVKWVIGYPAIVVSCAVVFIATLGAHDVALTRNSHLAYLGRISYGLYVYHVLALTVVSGLFLNGGSDWRGFVLTTVLGLVFTTVIASLSYKALEEPFLRLKRRFSYIDSGPPIAVSH